MKEHGGRMGRNVHKLEQTEIGLEIKLKRNIAFAKGNHAGKFKFLQPWLFNLKFFQWL